MSNGEPVLHKNLFAGFKKEKKPIRERDITEGPVASNQADGLPRPQSTTSGENKDFPHQFTVI